MKEYLNVLQKILDEGVEKESGRANMPNTIGISKADISMDLSKGFPLLTTKKMYFKGIIHELLWFLRGETNIKYLVDNDVNIWNQDAYRWYLKQYDDLGLSRLGKSKFGLNQFINHIRNNKSEDILCYVNDKIEYKVGDLGKVYGYQWRNQNGVDQIKDVIEGLKSNPYSRYHIIDGWNKADFPEMALPPCHLLYQFIVRPLSFEERKNLYQPIPNIFTHGDLDVLNAPKFYLDLNMYQRSCDTFLGVPFNIASMSLLLMIFAEASNMIAGVANWIGGDTHMYVSHLDAVKEQLSRTPTKLPELLITKQINGLDDILDLTIDDFELFDYKSQDSIKAELFTGLKKK